MKLSDLTGVLSEAVEQAVRATETQVLERLHFYFEDPDPDDDDETLFPKFINIQIGGEKIKYPLLALGNLVPILVEEFSFELDTDLDLSGHEAEDGESHHIEISLKSGLFKNTSHIKITGKFKGGEPPEAYAQMQDKFNDMIAKALAKLNSEMEM